MSEPNDIPYGYCQCGCGEETRAATRTRNDRGIAVGQRPQFVKGHQARGADFAEYKAGPGYKGCPVCKKAKPLADFSPAAVYCKPCSALKQRERRKVQGDRMRAADRDRYAQRDAGQRERDRATRRRWHEENHERQAAKSRESHIKARYGMTLDEYEAKIAAGCVICGSHGRMGIDHCHASGKVRDALCGNCNTALGLIGDDPERARALIRYLNTHRER